MRKGREFSHSDDKVRQVSLRELVEMDEFSAGIKKNSAQSALLLVLGAQYANCLDLSQATAARLSRDRVE